MFFLDFSCFAIVAFQRFANYSKSLGNWIRTEMLKLQFCKNVEIYENLVFLLFLYLSARVARCPTAGVATVGRSRCVRAAASMAELGRAEPSRT